MRLMLAALALVLIVVSTNAEAIGPPLGADQGHWNIVKRQADALEDAYSRAHPEARRDAAGCRLASWMLQQAGVLEMGVRLGGKSDLASARVLVAELERVRDAVCDDDDDNNSWRAAKAWEMGLSDEELGRLVGTTELHRDLQSIGVSATSQGLGVAHLVGLVTARVAALLDAGGIPVITAGPLLLMVDLELLEPKKGVPPKL